MEIQYSTIQLGRCANVAKKKPLEINTMTQKRYVEDLPIGELNIILYHLTKVGYSSLTDEKQWLLKIVAEELEKRSKNEN